MFFSSLAFPRESELDFDAPVRLKEFFKERINQRIFLQFNVTWKILKN